MECTICQNRIVMHAFSEGECKICGDKITYHCSPCTSICQVCSSETNRCEYCEKEIKK